MQSGLYSADTSKGETVPGGSSRGESPDPLTSDLWMSRQAVTALPVISILNGTATTVAEGVVWVWFGLGLVGVWSGLGLGVGGAWY